MSFSHTRLNSASELVQQAPKEISGRVSDLYDVVSQAMGKEKEKVARKMSQIKETVGDGARGAVKKIPWQVSEKGGDEPLVKFRMAARKTLRLRQQSKLDLNEQIQKIKDDDLLGISEEKEQEPETEHEDEATLMKQALTCTVDTEFHNLTDEIRRDVCSSTLRLFHDVESLHSKDENKLMLEYIRKIFSGIPKETFDSLNREAKQLSDKDKVLTLKCKVIKANNLPAKDFGGTSDPYCVVSILNKEHIDTKLVRFDNIKEWKEEGLIAQTWQSSIKMKTLNPDWNETFEMPISDPQSQYLAIELWDSDKDQKGLAKFIHKKDDFLGRVFYLLQHVPVSGEEKTLELKSHSTKSSRGMLTIFMDIVGKKVDREPEEGYLSHKQLLECVISYESKTEDGHSTHWVSELPEEAEKLLIQHASLYRISQLQHAAIRLNILLNYHRVHAIAMHSLSNILHTIQHHESEVLPTHKNSSTKDSTPFWVNQLVKDLEELRVYITDIMKRHLDIFNNFKSVESISLLKDHIIVLHDLYQIRLLKSKLSAEQLDLRAVLTNAIQSAVPSWMNLLIANMMPSHSSSEDKLILFKGFCSHCQRQCQRSLERVHPVFMEVGVDYFSPFFVSVDKIIHGEAMNCLENRGSTKNGLMTYEIYKTIQEIAAYSNKIDPEFLKSQRVELSITSFQDWFKGCVPDWVDVAQTRVKERLKRAVELDTIVKTSDNAPFSSSAVDTHAFFLQVITFWKQLKWPDRGQSLGYFINIVQCLCEMTAYYSDRIVAKTKDESYTDSEGRFVVTDKLCVALNNIHHVSHVLMNIRAELDLETYYKWLDEEKQHDGLPLSQRADTIINDLLESANEDVLNKIDKVITVVKTQLSPSVLEFIPNILDAPSSSPTDKVVEPLIEYITGNVGKLGESLLTPLFLNILRHLWVQIVQALRNTYDKIPHSSANPLHVRLNLVLLDLSDFFEADGKGLSRRFIESEYYMELRDSLFYAIQPTEDVVKRFCYDVVRQQAFAKNEFGQLHISHLYNQNKKTLSVEIISGEKLPALDRSGKSDPFVQVHLLPAFVFPEANEKIHKTSTKKQTLDPIFNETIKLHAKPEQLSKDGSILLLAIFDHDTFGSNDFAGLCAVPCTSIPKEGTEPKIEHLHLFHYEKTDAFKELELRHTDSMAQDFLKHMKKFEFDGETQAGHPFHKLLHFTDKK
ncbi:PREDICTED: protein unc-13 homolog D-like [Amphimedon queenslandica]|uniref:Uncharacterized protein n=1 Tax=Amphimedon queenslandica TaxID=400682 RepID=A0A1X7VUE6_AMPQE|nr:PREDICTED: protein unc-13 homolog D-like [Amphimedon queenslandica]|eukprot:XP_019853517.1 PREDICTED: protein unc-13 homolog D-like [Amphimedon queenslandica]